jgi:hypothetical protein
MRRVVMSSVAAVLLFAGFLHVLGPARLVAQLAGADPVVFALGLLGVVLALACWSEATRRLFRSSGAVFTPRRAFVAYGTGAFGKQVLPMGNAGGPAVMAYAFDREAKLGYSRALAVVVVVELMSLAASIVLATVGIVVLLGQGAPTGAVRWLGVGVASIGLLLALLSLVIWYRRDGVTAALASGAALVRPTVARVAPGIATRLDPDRVAAGLERYYATVDEVFADRRSVLIAAALTQLGWVLFVVPLYTSGLALGVQLPLALVLFLVPAAGLTTAFPLPGGLGGLEIALAALLAALSVLELPESGAVVVLYRLCSFWFFVFVGGLCAFVATASVPDLADSIDAPVATLGDPPLVEEDTE